MDVAEALPEALRAIRGTVEPYEMPRSGAV
jgi:hypothetical protein